LVLLQGVLSNNIGLYGYPSSINIVSIASTDCPAWNGATH
jgi:hypothetical protein